MFKNLTPAQIAQNKADYTYKGGKLAARPEVCTAFLKGTRFVVKSGKTYRAYHYPVPYVGHDGCEYVTAVQVREDRDWADYGPVRPIKVSNILTVL